MINLSELTLILIFYSPDLPDYLLEYQTGPFSWLYSSWISINIWDMWSWKGAIDSNSAVVMFNML